MRSAYAYRLVGSVQKGAPLLKGASMCYWGNEWMPMIDALAIDAARSYVRQVGADFGHKWALDSKGNRFGTDEQAFRYLVGCIAEAHDAYGYDIDASTNDYPSVIFNALGFGITTLMDYDWDTLDDCPWCVRFDMEAAA